MPASIFHVKTNTVPDITNSGYGVLPSDWNSLHAVSLSLSGPEVIGAFANNSRMTFSTNGFGQIVGQFGGIRGTDLIGAFSNNSLGTFFTDASGNVQISVNPASVTLSAGGNTTLGNAVAFLNGNGVSFGLNGPFLTASVVSGTTVFSGPAIQISGSTPISSGTIIFSGSNVSLSQIGNTVVIQGNPAQTALTFSNSNNVSLGVIGGVVTASANNLALGVSGGNQTLTGGTAILYPGGAITLSQTNNSITISAPVQTSLSFRNSQGVTFGVAGSTLTASVSQSVQPAVAVQPFGAGVYTSGTVALAAGSNITLSTAGQTISIVGPGPNTTNTVGISAGGNVAGTPSLISIGTLVLAGGNNVTLSQNVSTITISAGQSAANLSIAAAGITNSVSEIMFSNANNITFGIAGSTVTASASASQSVQALTVQDAGGGSYNASTLMFSSNTTAPWVQFNAFGTQVFGVPFVGVSGSNTSGIASVIKFSNANGVSFGASTNGIITASVAPAGIAVSATNASSSGVNTLFFSASNNVTFGLSGGSIITATISVPPQTSLSFSNTQGVSFGIVGSTLTASVSTGILGVLFSAGTTQSTATALNFSNANGISFGLSNSTVLTASAVQQSINISAGTQSSSLSALVFSNSNSLSFGLSNGTITASYSIPAFSTQTLGLFPAGNTAGNSTQSTITQGSGWLVGGNNVTVSQTGNSFIFNAGTAAAAQLTISAGGNSSALGSIIFSNLNGVSWGLSAGSIITASVLTNAAMTISASNTSATTPILKFSNGNGVSWSYNSTGSFIQASISTNNQITVAVPGSTNTVAQLTFTNGSGVTFSLAGSVVNASINAITAVNVSAGTTSNNLTALTFANSNGVTFGLNASTVTASVAIAAGNIGISDSAQSATFSSITLGTINGQTLYLSNGSLVGSYTVPVANTYSFSNANNVSFTNNASTIVASASFSQSVQPLTISGANGSYSATALSFLTSGNVKFSTSSTAVFANASVNLSAGTTSSNMTAWTYSNANNVSFGLGTGASAGNITASASFNQTSFVLSNSFNVSFTTNGSTVNASASFPAQTSLSFSNANNVSFGIAGSTITATATLPAASITVSGNGTTNALNSLVFNNANNITFGLSASTITASYSQSVPSVTISATNGSFSLTSPALTFADGNNIKFSTSAGGILSASAFEFVTADNGSSANASQIYFASSNGITFGVSKAGGGGQAIVTASYTVPTQTNQTVGLSLLGNTTLTSTGTFDARSLVISASTNLTAGFSAGTLILSGGAGGAGGTLSITATGNTTVGTTGSGNPLFVSGAGGVLSVGINANTLYISAPGSTSFSPLSVGISTQGNTAGTTGFFTNAYQVVGGSNITLSQSTNTNGATVSVIGGVPQSQSISASGNLNLTTTTNASGSVFIFQAPPLVQMQRIDYGNATSTTLGQGSMVVVPLVNVFPFTATRLGWPVFASTTMQGGSTGSTGGITVGAMAGLYTLTGSTLSLVTASTGVQTYGTTITTASSTNQSSIFSNWNGQKEITVPMNVNYTGGDVWLAIFSTTSSANYPIPLSFSNACQSIVASYNNVFNAAPAATIGEFTGLGVYSASTTSLPASIALTAINVGSNFNGLFPAVVFRNI